MAKKTKLSEAMTEVQFDNGYWYAIELKRFAANLGIPSSSKLRKDELEKTIKTFLRTGKLKSPRKQSSRSLGSRDTKKRLKLNRRIENYTNDKETKEFLLKQAKKMDPSFTLQSGTRYPLNRWREEQIAKGNKITYGDLVKHFVKLNKGPRKPLRTTHGRYNNFVADFLKANKKADRKQMIEAWNELKEIDAPKTYQAWAKYINQRVGRAR